MFHSGPLIHWVNMKGFGWRRTFSHCRSFILFSWWNKVFVLRLSVVVVLPHLLLWTWKLNKQLSLTITICSFSSPKEMGRNLVVKSGKRFLNVSSGCQRGHKVTGQEEPPAPDRPQTDAGEVLCWTVVCWSWLEVHSLDGCTFTLLSLRISEASSFCQQLCVWFSQAVNS